MTSDESSNAVYWARTVGAPTPNDPRDGELHQGHGAPPDAFDLEPWDDEPGGVDAHYVRDQSSPPVEEDGRVVWQYVYTPR